jgi:hypothetical protein
VSSLLPYFFLLLLLLIPSNKLQQFDGLPFSYGVEFLALALLLPFLFSKQLRQNVADLFHKLHLPLGAFYAAGIIVLFLKAGLFFFGGPNGFIGCYFSPVPWAPSYPGQGPSGACERSYEDLFHRSGATRIDPAIDFTPDSWNLIFLNSLRYDFPDSATDSIPRSRIPISARWSGQIDLEQAARVIVRYTGTGQLSVGALTMVFPPSYGQVGEIAADFPAGKQTFTLAYSFDDGSRMGQAAETWGPGAQIHMAIDGGAGQQLLRTISPGLPVKAAAWGADILFILLIFTLMISFLTEVWRDKWVVAIVLVFLVGCYFLPFSQRVRGLGMTAVLIGFWLWYLFRRPVKPISVYAVLFGAGLAITLLFLPLPSRVILRSAQDDPLTLESYAYSILSSGSLEAGEKVFFAQPMFRYIKFTEHMLFGDGGTFYGAVQLALFFGGAFFLFGNVLRSGITPGRRWILAVIGSAVFFLGGYYVSIVIRTGLSEYPTWSLMLWILPLLFFRETLVTRFVCLVALAFSFTVRTNQAVAILCLLLLAFHGLWKQNRKAFFGGVAVTAFLLLLPLFHNVYYGHEFVLTTSSLAVPQNLPLPLSVWMAFLRGDATAAAAVLGQLKLLFLAADVTFSTRLTLAAMAICLLIWVPVFLHAVIRRRIAFEYLLLSVPLLYLAPHLFFDVRVYYPRLFFIGYLSMAAVTAVWLARGKSKNAEPATSTVEAGTR